MVSYGYSSRLRVALTNQQPTGSWTSSYTYDPARRLTGISGPSGSFGYLYVNAANSVGAGTLAGRVLLPNSAYLTNTYDSTEFTYDGRGRMRLKKDYVWNPYSGAWALSAETRYVYDGTRVTRPVRCWEGPGRWMCRELGRIPSAGRSRCLSHGVKKRDGNNVPTLQYTRGLDLSGTLEGAGGIGGLLARSHTYTNGVWLTNNYYAADGNGNVTFLLTTNQTCAAEFRYDPFGRTVYASESLPTPNLYRFSSKLLHANSGLYYYGYRFYDPNVQRWVNRDPIEELGGINLYRYCANSPLNLTDDLGLRVDPPPRNIGFTLDEVEGAVNFAHKCKIKGPNDMDTLRMRKQMLESRQKLTWWAENAGTVPSTHALTEAPTTARVHFPKCDPCSRQKDIKGSGETTFYFQAAILHELVHAYGRMTGQGGLAGDAVRVGNEMQKCLDACGYGTQP